MREITKERVTKELKELVRLSQRYGYTTALQEHEVSEQAGAAISYGERTYQKLSELLKLIETWRNEAYIAGVADGETGEAGRGRTTS